MNYPKNRKIIHFRADGNSQIGLGHLIRCQSLAEMIKNNYNIHFYSRKTPDSIKEDLNRSGFTITTLKHENEFFNSIHSGDGVVVDGYSFGTDYYSKILSRGCKLILIDDLHDQQVCADLIINPAPGVSESDYQIQRDCTVSPIFALGPDYALLRPAFFNTEPGISVKRNMNHLFICFGGSDVKNMTEKVLAAAIDFKQFEKITIITGSGYLHHDDLKRRFSGYEHTYLYHGVGETVMAAKLAEADIAIVPSSGMLIEALSMQPVVISGMYVENQKALYTGFKKLNAFIDAGTFEIEMVKIALEKAGDFKPNTIIDRKSPERYRALFETVMN